MLTSTIQNECNKCSQVSRLLVIYSGGWNKWEQSLPNGRDGLLVDKGGSSGQGNNTKGLLNHNEIEILNLILLVLCCIIYVGDYF